LGEAHASRIGGSRPQRKTGQIISEGPTPKKAPESCRERTGFHGGIKQGKKQVLQQDSRGGGRKENRRKGETGVKYIWVCPRGARSSDLLRFLGNGTKKRQYHQKPEQEKRVKLQSREQSG